MKTLVNSKVLAVLLIFILILFSFAGSSNIYAQSLSKPLEDIGGSTITQDDGSSNTGLYIAVGVIITGLIVWLLIPSGEPEQLPEYELPKGIETSKKDINLSVLNIDIDQDIPKISTNNEDAIAVIIGNKNYRKKDIPSVDYAIDDASIMKQYLINMLGYSEENIIYTTNAAQGDFNAIFGTNLNYKGKLYNYVKEGKSDVFIYYSGHGAPDPESKQGYFVPVDCDPSFVSLNGYSLNTFYDNLSKISYKSLTVVIDACFSGSSDKGTLLKNISPIYISIENPMINRENTTVFTSSTGEQVSSWYPEKKHSLFTYYFLKGLKGEANLDNDDRLTVGELEKYISGNVPYMARRLNNREQTPTVIGDKNKVFIEY